MPTNSAENGIPAKGYAVDSAQSPFRIFDFTRREPREDDVLIRIHYCGICHSDIHQAYNDWNSAKYPLLPGHEITGVVERFGKNVVNFEVGDYVGVGCVVDSCRACQLCHEHLEQYCPKVCFTYNSIELDGTSRTYGGYSNLITVRQNYVMKIPKNLPLDAAAPLLCAGITSYSPLKQYKVDKNTRLGIVGFGGLGHMAIKFGVAMGAQVTVISTSESKRDDAKKLGAKGFILSKNKDELIQAKSSLDLIIDTVAAIHDLGPLIDLLVFEGIFCLVGAPSKSLELNAFSLLRKRPKLTGSIIGGMKETQEMLDFCGKHNITCDIEKIDANPDSIKTAFERTLRADVKYRFVLDIKKAFE